MAPPLPFLDAKILNEIVKFLLKNNRVLFRVIKLQDHRITLRNSLIKPDTCDDDGNFVAQRKFEKSQRPTIFKVL